MRLPVRRVPFAWSPSIAFAYYWIEQVPDRFQEQGSLKPGIDGGVEYKGNDLERVFQLDQPQELEPVHPWHQGIGDDLTGPVRTGPVKSFLSVTSLDHRFAAVPFQVQSQ